MSEGKGKGKGRRRHRRKKWREVEGMWVNSRVPLTRGQQHHLECRRVCRQRRQERGAAAAAAVAAAVPPAAIPASAVAAAAGQEVDLALVPAAVRRQPSLWSEVTGRMRW
jgi:hypothetical protein